MSQNRNHLIPTTVTNKNGVPTTVYKKPPSSTPDTSKLPSVAVARPASDRELLEIRTADSITMGLGPALLGRTYGEVLRSVSTFSDKTLRRLIGATSANIDYPLNPISYLCQEDAEEEYINDWIAVEQSSQDKSVDWSPSLRGLKEYKNLVPQEDEHYPPQREAQIVALARVTVHLGRNGHGVIISSNDKGEIVNHIKDEKLRDLIITHEDPTTIADIIATRNITDLEQITQLLNTMDQIANPIKEGAL